jgi:hypothetical protein
MCKSSLCHILHCPAVKPSLVQSISFYNPLTFVGHCNHSHPGRYIDYCRDSISSKRSA